MVKRMNKKLSIIVPIYNPPEEYLRRCLDSVIAQTYKEIEIILVNDGSKEEIKQICEEFANKDNRIKLINQENSGESVSRNVGIENATTDNIIFVDSDDWIEKNLCEEIISVLEKINYKYDVIIHNCYIDYSKKSSKNTFYNKSGWLNNSDIEEIQLQNIEKGITKYYPKDTNISVVWAKVYNKKFIVKNNLKFIPNIIRMPDTIFNIEAFEKAKKIYMFPKYLYHYQKNENSICQKYSEDTINYYETFIEYVKKYIEKYNKNERFKDTLNIKICTSIDKYMYNYYFHKDNPKKKNLIIKEFKELLDKELYIKAIESVKTQYLSIYQRLVIKNAKKKRIHIMRILKEIKMIIKSVQGEISKK